MLQGASFSGVSELKAACTTMAPETTATKAAETAEAAEAAETIKTTEAAETETGEEA
ncbi:hypothetical protein [Paenibacillus ehimensis]|uniref:Uncharacterized protein n=1 Tax=Paenibacillus ehimensis TaxID=79264 RepID=A0ABT8VKR3_9BACL|nr:hypothetical protein [Paenibacillus ehimensis]MDO3681545.1 hypothetical protein [Paenibacillus ehimensis]MEC0209181.1 hypothetical protein [Paenibacillus ehimensis]